MQTFSSQEGCGSSDNSRGSQGRKSQSADKDGEFVKCKRTRKLNPNHSHTKQINKRQTNVF